MMISCRSLNFTVPPFSIRILLVDDDFTHLSTLEQALLSFGYKVTTFHSPEAALVTLQRKKHKFDIVVCGVPVSNVHGFNLIQTAEIELNIPVVLMTSNYSKDAVGGILSGASECVEKPVLQPQILKNIWQLVVSRRRNEFISFLYSAQQQPQGQMSINSSKVSPEIGREAGAATAHGGDPGCSNPNNLKMMQDQEGGEGCYSDHNHQDLSRKPRFIWTDELHRMFLDGIKKLKLEFGKIVPTKILEYMRNNGVRNITRENVASHLQKYRLSLKKNNDEVDQSSKLTSQSDQTLSLQNITTSPCSTSHLPIQNLTQDEQEAPPNDQPIEIEHPPSNEITPFVDQKNIDDIDWDIHDGIPVAIDFQTSSIWSNINHILESEENPFLGMEHYCQPQLVPLGQEENIFSVGFSHTNEILPSTLSNQVFNTNDNNGMVRPPLVNNSEDLNNNFWNECLCYNVGDSFGDGCLNPNNSTSEIKECKVMSSNRVVK